MKKTAFANRPISTVEHIHYLHNYYDLTEEAREVAFSQYDNEYDARWHMDNVYEELANTHEWFEEQTGHTITLDSVHGPGTERYFPKYDYWENGPEEVVRIEKWYDCYQLDVMEAWNRHIDTINAYALITQAMEDVDEESEHYDCWGVIEAQNLYMSEVEEALKDVCKALNNLEDEERKYTDTREFFEYNHLDTSDDEHWYTADGIREFVRDASSIWTIDTCNECDEIYECNNPMVLVVREYEEV